MLRSLWLLFLYVSFIGLSTNAPFIATLGYVWVDTFQPQDVAYIILRQIPVALIMGIVAVGTYLLVDRRAAPPLTAVMVLQLIMVGLITATTLWAEVPDMAWVKWDWAFKTMVFSAFVPFVIRSRVQIEAFAQCYVLSLSANFIPFGIKTLISGGGYGTNLGLARGNSGLAEGGLLSTFCLMVVPIILYLAKNSQLVPQWKVLRFAYWGIAALAIATAIGTYERSALIGLVVLGGAMWMRSKHKLGFGLVVCAVTAVVIYATSSAWNERISSIGNYQSDNSSYTRLMVWKWTLEYTATHPWGGGFYAFLINHIEVPGMNGEPATMQFGRAFHSIYFEVLGEQGYLGLGLFLSITALTFINLHRIARKAQAHPELAWVAGLANALQSGLAVFMTAGAFVGIAFQPMYWYFVALGISLNAYMQRVGQGDAPATATWRQTIIAPLGPRMQSGSGGSSWRNRPGLPTIKANEPYTKGR